MSDSTDILDKRSFKRLRDSEIVDVMARAINITETVCWSAIYELRARYPSTNAWGDFLRREKLSPESPFWSISDSTVKRWVRCGKLADQLKIKDFSELKIKPSAFDLLTMIKDDLEAEKAFHKIKKETVDKGYSLSIKEVEQVINQVCAVQTVPKPDTPEPRRMTEVIQGVDREPAPVSEIEFIESLPAYVEYRQDDIVEDDIVIDVEMGMGDAKATVWSCDFSYEYVKINGEYHT